MQIAVFGLNHRTASVELRERMTWDENELPNVLTRLKDLTFVDEALLLSTCNRTEIVAAHRCQNNEEAKKQLTEFYAEACELQPTRFQDALYWYTGEEAVNHLYRVAAGLDAMILGETQILSQVKEAYCLAQECQAIGKYLHALLNGALSTAKQVHTDTAVSTHAVSVSYAAVELARKIFGQLENCSALLIGAGETAELTARHLADHGLQKIYVANRTLARAQMLAEQYQGTGHLLSEVPTLLEKVDVVISSTGAHEHMIDQNTVRSIMRKRRGRSLFLVDIAVPRDIEPAIGGVEHVFLYDIDDLKAVVAANLEERSREAKQAQILIAKGVDRFMSWLRSRDAVPLIRSLHEKADHIKEQELQKAFNRMPDLDDRQREVISNLVTSVTNKLLNDPTVRVKQFANNEDAEVYLEAFSEMFNLPSPHVSTKKVKRNLQQAYPVRAITE